MVGWIRYSSTIEVGQFEYSSVLRGTKVGQIGNIFRNWVSLYNKVLKWVILDNCRSFFRSTYTYHDQRQPPTESTMTELLIASVPEDGCSSESYRTACTTAPGLQYRLEAAQESKKKLWLQRDPSGIENGTCSEDNS